MNFSIHLEDPLAKRLKSFAKQKGKTRNSLIREAIQSYLGQHENQEWPKSAYAFLETKNIIPNFESYRNELGQSSEDPLL